MNTLIKVAASLVSLVVLCSAATAVTLTFDDVPSGTALWPFYVDAYQITFTQSFYVLDHTVSSWGPPHSAANVAVLGQEAATSGHAGVTFGYLDHTGAGRLDSIRSVGAYFSTQTGATVTVSAYWMGPGVPPTLMDTQVIGAQGESWSNRYVQIGSASGGFNMLDIQGVNSPQELLGWCMDDMTITPVPEPTSMLALAAGLAGVALRRRR